MIYLLVLIAQLADLLTFFCAASVLPIHAEGNPLARYAYEAGGIGGVAVLKTIGVGLILAGMSLSEGWALSVIVGAAVALGVLGAVVNTAAVMVAR